VKPALIFDFDFTLADSSKGFLACHHHALMLLGLPQQNPLEALRTIGMSLPEAFRYLYGPEHLGLLGDYLDAWQHHADRVMTEMTFLLDGAQDAVRQLRAEGHSLAIVSQKLRHRVEAVLEREGIIDSFEVILGGGDVARFKPEPDGLQLAMRRLRADPDSSLYVGDTVIDAEAARRAGLPFIAVLSGVTEADAFSSYECLAVLEGVRDIPGFLRGHAS
jgi:phosphoglycolate phosphatase